MRSWPLANKIRVASATLALVAVAIGAYAISTLRQYGAVVAEMEAASQRAIIGERINSLVLAVVMDSRGIYMSDRPDVSEKYAKPLLANLETLKTQVAQWKTFAPADQLDQYDEAEQATLNFIRFRTELVRLSREASLPEARTFGDNDANRKVRKALNDKLTVLTDRNAQEVQVLGDEVPAVYRRSLDSILAVLVIGLGAGLGVVSWVASRQIVRPIRQLTEVMGRLARGDLEVAIPASEGRKDEIGDIARAVAVFKAQAIAVHAAEIRREADRAAAEADKVASLRAMADTIERETRHALDAVSAQTGAMSAQASHMAQSALDVIRESQGVATAANQAKSNVQAVAAATQQLSTSIGEISEQVSGAAHSARLAVEATQSADQRIRALSEAVGQIGEVSRMITDIAGRTNLLALNATIEAARAGEAGKGFAVVAGEVKSLANQTAAATGEIAARIETIRSVTAEAVAAVDLIAQSIRAVDGISAAIAAAVEEQSAATGEIARNVAETGRAAGEVSERIGMVANQSEDTGRRSETVQDTAGLLNRAVEALSVTLIHTVRTATSDVDRRTLARRRVSEQCMVDGPGKCASCELFDVCETGASIVAAGVDFKPGETLALTVPGHGVTVQARVRGTRNGRVGLALDQPLPNTLLEAAE
ncbi:methyl-accepting chemotaxis protein [Magnetospirillum sp. LM-5]|uniref:methyl-accepting chemotaxis protein n=1 Tax=Magnetospirillum sp. LM-5 TaxID=2681466 RepID=UPI00156D6E75|nr:methyl-accepting chemotaxis protein [Magnetospirillum sp. LM-5]